MNQKVEHKSQILLNFFFISSSLLNEQNYANQYKDYSKTNSSICYFF